MTIAAAVRSQPTQAKLFIHPCRLTAQAIDAYVRQTPAITFRLSDELLNALGNFYQGARMFHTGVTFEQFLLCPRRYGFLRPIEHAINENERRLLPRQRYVAAFVARFSA